MKKLHLLTAISSLAFATAAQAAVQDITTPNLPESEYSAISASNVNQDPRSVDGIYQVGYVHAGCVTDKVWDLEAFGFDQSTDMLTYVGGFNPTQPILDEGINWTLGDIFLTTGGITPTAPNLTKSDGAALDYTNGTHGSSLYSYAIHFTPIPGSTTTLSYSIYQLTSSAQLETPYFNQNMDSGPFVMDPLDYAPLQDGGNGTATDIFDSTTPVTVTKMNGADVNGLLNVGLDGLFNTATDLTSDDNYVASFDLSTLANNYGMTTFNADLTEMCGNDSLTGASSASPDLLATPEPSTLGCALVGLFVLGGTVLVRRKLQ